MPRKNPLPNFIPLDNVVVYYKPGSKTFDSTVLIEGFIKRVLIPHKLRNGQERSFLLIDSAPCHRTKEVEEKLNEHHIDLEFIPPRMTALLQPADVSWIRKFKCQYHSLWQDWALNSEKSFTVNGNLKSPSYATIINWISGIWRHFDKKLVIDSFKQTGIIQNDETQYHSALRHIMQSNELPTNIVEEFDGTEDLNEMFVDDDDEEPYESSSDYDDSSDDENNASYTPTLILSQSDDAEEKMDSENSDEDETKENMDSDDSTDSTDSGPYYMLSEDAAAYLKGNQEIEIE